MLDYIILSIIFISVVLSNANTSWSLCLLVVHDKTRLNSWLIQCSSNFILLNFHACFEALFCHHWLNFLGCPGWLQVEMDDRDWLNVCFVSALFTVNLTWSKVNSNIVSGGNSCSKKKSFYKLLMHVQFTLYLTKEANSKWQNCRAQMFSESCLSHGWLH